MPKLARKKSAPKTLTPAKFWALSDEKRRIMVAKDVIKHVKSGKFLPRSACGFFIVGNENDDDFFTSRFGFDRDALIKLGHCQVCGLGACLASAVMLGNKFSIENNTDLEGFFIFLKKIFSAKTLALIEIAFEGGRGAFLQDAYSVSGVGESRIFKVRGITDDEFDAARCFSSRFQLKSDETNLIAIMKNIIKNKGEFIPFVA